MTEIDIFIEILDDLDIINDIAMPTKEVVELDPNFDFYDDQLHQDVSELDKENNCHQQYVEEIMESDLYVTQSPNTPPTIVVVDKISISFTDMVCPQVQVSQSKDICTTVLSKGFKRYIKDKKKQLDTNIYSKRMAKVLKKVFKRPTIWPNRILRNNDKRLISEFKVTRSKLLEYFERFFVETLTFDVVRHYS